MSKKIKSSIGSSKLSKNTVIDSDSRVCNQIPAISFTYLTGNSNHNFDYFGSSRGKDREMTSDKLLGRLIEITQEPWSYWYRHNKFNGLEMLGFDQIRISPSGISLSDQKIIVFRFRRYDGLESRILGFRNGNCPTLHIIGFDFNHSAYDHGS